MGSSPALSLSFAPTDGMETSFALRDVSSNSRAKLAARTQTDSGVGTREEPKVGMGMKEGNGLDVPENGDPFESRITDNECRECMISHSIIELHGRSWPNQKMIYGYGNCLFHPL